MVTQQAIGPAGGEQDTNTGTGEGDEGAGGGDASEVAQLRAAVAAQDTQLKQVLGFLQGLTQGRPQDGQRDTGQDDAGEALPELPADLETRPLREVLSLHEERVTRGIEQRVIKPLQETITGLRTQLHKAEASAQVAELRGKHKDFHEWGPEIADYIRENPHAAAKLGSVYQIVRSENAEKAKRLDAKYGGRTEGEGEGAPKQTASPRPPQLRPDGRGTKAQRSARMSADEAAEAAWNSGAGAELDAVLRQMDGG